MAKEPKEVDMIREAILVEYERRRKADPESMKPYQLWKLVEGTGVSRATIYAFLGGKTTLNTSHASQLLAALGASIVFKRHTGK